MTETLIVGTISGLTVGLLAVGLVLVYKANRFINLAHAQLGALSAVLLAKLVLDWGLSWWFAFPVAVIVGVGTGFVVERWIIRPLRLRGRATETLLLASIGVSQVLLALVLIPAVRPDTDELLLQGYPLPFDAHVTVGGVVLGSHDLMIIAAVPVLVGGLAVFLRYTLMGKMIRGAASNPEAARLCGISIGRVSAVTWGLAGGLSAVAAVLIAPSQGSFDGAQLAPGLLLRALGAAALGGFVSVPAALVGGVGVGLLEQYALYFTSDGSDALLVVFGAILLIFVARGRVINRATGHEEGGNAHRPPLRVPSAIADRFLVRRQPVLLACTGLAVGVVLPLVPYFGSDAHRFQLTLIVVYALVGVALTMVAGWAGQVSLGHFALVGVGAFITARLSPDGWSLPALLVLSGAAGAAVLMVAGLPALRLRGLTLAVTTLGVAVVTPVWLFRQDWFGSDTSFGILVEPVAITSDLGRPYDAIEVYYVALVVLGLVLLSARMLRRSSPGRVVVAVRDNEIAAASFAITPATIKLSILAVSGFVAGSSGVLWALAWRNVSSGQFDPSLSLSVLAVPVIGGLGSLSGAVVGSVLLYAPAFFLAPLAEVVFGEFSAQIGFQLALAGAGLLIILLTQPTGVAGKVQEVWEQRLARLAANADLRAPRDTAIKKPEVPPGMATNDLGLRTTGMPRTNSSAQSDSRQEMSPTSPDETPLVVDEVALMFGGIRALDGASIRVGQGEIVGLIGPNGAGKTTLLNTVSGVLRADGGSVRLFGNEVVDLPAEYRLWFGLGRSFQSAHLFPGLTVTETVQVAMAARHRVGFVSSALAAPWVRHVERQTRAEARDLLEQLNLGPWATSLTSELSTGTRRICDLAAQLAAKPKLLLLDEPTAGVAQRECEVFPPLLRRIREELDCSILVVEHDMPLLMGLCDRVYAMESGRVIAEGTPDEVRSDPAVISGYLGTDDAAINRSNHERAATVPPISRSNGRGPTMRDTPQGREVKL